MQRVKNLYHLFQAILACTVYGFPARSMKVICVTGTDGKTTTAGMIYHILHKSGYKTALLTTVSAIIDGKSYDTGFHVTTPSSYALQKYFKQAKKAGAKYFVLETTSHGIDQKRIWGIPIEIGVLTNITHEHLDYHGTYQKYLKAKVQMLKSAKKVVINHDDQSYALVRQELARYKGKIVTYGRDKSARVNLKNFVFATKLLGEFNLYNSLSAAASCQLLGLKDREIKSGIASYTPPLGRQEIVYDKSYRVMIDFAHTPNSFLKILPELKKISQKRLIHVFGSAGKRDISKRDEMGKASSLYSDIMVITAEDPRGEKVEEIAKQIIEGVSGFEHLKVTELRKMKNNEKYCFVIPDRREAVNFAIKLAKSGDSVVITGKSHEKSMNLDGKHEEDWDEFKVTKEAIAAKND